MKKRMFDFKEKAVKAETTAKPECLNEGQVLGWDDRNKSEKAQVWESQSGIQ